MSRELETILEENQSAAKERVSEIHTFITDEIDADAALEFDSNSKTAEWNLWTEVVAILSYILELFWDTAKAELEEIKETGIAANRYFFAREWKAFQYGDDLLINDETGKYYYETIDSEKQIIKRLAIIQSANNWLVKVATEEAGNPIQLTTPQLTAFKTFVDRTQPAGPAVQVLSLPSDKVNIEMTVYYNPIEPLDDLKPLVEAAYLEYLDEIDINGDAVYYLTKHIDKIQEVPNVVDAVITTATAKIDGQAYGNIDRIYSPFSGYLELDPALNIEDLITYTPES